MNKKNIYVHTNDLDLNKGRVYIQPLLTHMTSFLHSLFQ